MGLITKGMGAIIKGLGSKPMKGLGKIKKGVPKAIPRPKKSRPKKFKLTKDDAFVGGAGVGTVVTSEIHREKKRTPSPHRTRKSGGGRIGFEKGKSAVSKSGGITHKSQSGIGPSKKSQKKYYDTQRDAVREMNMSGRGKQLRYESFTDKKTGRLVPDTERNRERYGKDRVYKSPEKITKIWKKGKPTYKATNKGKE